MRKFTPKEKEKLQAMIDEQNRDREKRQKAYLRRKANIQTAGRISESGFRDPTANPPLKSAMHRTEHHRDVRYSKHSELKRMQLTEKEKKDLKDKVWEKIRERHKS